MLIRKIISGGQTGVDRAALDFARDSGVSYGGWCPKGRRAEDGIIDKRYPLKETLSDDYSERTRLNIISSDGTLVLHQGILDSGTKLTLEVCKELSKPFLTIDMTKQTDKAKFQYWIEKNNISKLNIAGSRESNDTGIYIATFQFLKKLFG